MRMFWTLFFIGSMLIVGTDVAARRQNPGKEPMMMTAEGDAMGIPTPNP